MTGVCRIREWRGAADWRPLRAERGLAGGCEPRPGSLYSGRAGAHGYYHRDVGPQSMAGATIEIAVEAGDARRGSPVSTWRTPGPASRTATPGRPAGSGPTDYEWDRDGGLVRLVFEGDPDAVVAAESDRWRAFDVLNDWTVRRYGPEASDCLLAQQRDATGDRGGVWEYRVTPLVARFSLSYLREFGTAAARRRRRRRQPDPHRLPGGRPRHPWPDRLRLGRRDRRLRTGDVHPAEVPGDVPRRRRRP
jgi:hypothetical protein